MKNLKLLILTLFSILSLSVFSQNMVYTTQTSGPNVCDGVATLDTSNVNMTSIYWQGMGMIINQGASTVINLCPGTYTVTFTTLNGTPVTLTFIITSNPCFNFTGTLATTNQTAPALCDGSISVLPTGGSSPYTYMWSNGSTTQTISQLCQGSYCCNLVDVNGCQLTLCDSIGMVSPNFGDTLVINNNGNCQTTINGQMSVSIEDCNLDYNAVDTAFIYSITTPTNPLDSILCVWNVVDTNGVVTFYTAYYTLNNNFQIGCYNLQLVVYCLQKNLNYKTIIVNQPQELGFVGISELSPNNKKIIKVLDLTGREVKPSDNQILIYVYSDGTFQRVMQVSK